ncbi:MAG: hypothetical protein A2583_08670 [Bdellovibrionales bacterium RIFOXYD1_FULL_53_11]|nr:MAG: hypothetical protein A2583_08670 [Bdellovibrionales bacterium RIFOXYD1_FULL_53_11]
MERSPAGDAVLLAASGAGIGFGAITGLSGVGEGGGTGIGALAAATGTRFISANNNQKIFERLIIYSSSCLLRVPCVYGSPLSYEV